MPQAKSNGRVNATKHSAAILLTVKDCVMERRAGQREAVQAEAKPNKVELVGEFYDAASA
jgi:hypothetical protein